MKTQREKLQWIPTTRLLTLKRNPQYLTPRQMDSLKASIKRDGFVACFLREPNAPAARGDADAGAFSEQPWN